VHIEQDIRAGKSRNVLCGRFRFALVLSARPVAAEVGKETSEILMNSPDSGRDPVQGLRCEAQLLCMSATSRRWSSGRDRRLWNEKGNIRDLDREFQPQAVRVAWRA